MLRTVEAQNHEQAVQHVCVVSGLLTNRCSGRLTRHALLLSQKHASPQTPLNSGVRQRDVLSPDGGKMKAILWSWLFLMFYQPAFAQDITDLATELESGRLKFVELHGNGSSSGASIEGQLENLT